MISIQKQIEKQNDFVWISIQKINILKNYDSLKNKDKIQPTQNHSKIKSE